LIDFKGGYYIKGMDSRNRIARIRPTAKLIKEFKEARISTFDIGFHKNHETVVLRDENKKNIEYEDTLETHQMRDFLEHYNNMLRQTHIDCSHLDQRYVSSSDRKINLVSQQNKFIKRIFSRRSWTQGGRFYGGFWQNIPKEHRKYIRINGERTVEIDYSAIHITLLYSMKGIHYFNEYGLRNDPYDIPVPEVKSDKDKRWLLKNLLLTAVNAVNDVQTFRAFQNEATKTKFKIDGVSFTFDFLRGILKKLQDKHQPIANMLCSDSGINLQYQDSRITDRILKCFARDNVIVLPIHDSYIVAERYSEELREIMYDAWAIEAGLCVCGDQNERLSLETNFTSVKQKGYVDELYLDDINEHNKIIHIKEQEYVSPRYKHDLDQFHQWLVDQL